MARRFIVNKENIIKNKENIYEIIGPEVKHIQVLRHNVGDEIIVNDGIYMINKMTRDSVLLKYIKDAPIIGIPNTDITLYIAFLKSEKMDFLVQKAVELGVKKIVPFFSSNVIVKLDEKDRAKRKLKLQKIADEACKQCGRMDVVVIEDFVSFNELTRCQINQMKEEAIKRVGIIIGAEGGFTSKEADLLKQIDNVSCVSLGTRILRAETAAINLLSIVIYEMEE